MAVRRDIGARLQANGQAMAGLIHLMKIVVLAQPRIGRCLSAQLGKQRLIEKARLRHGRYRPLTA